jgi:hypothetical protein
MRSNEYHFISSWRVEGRVEEVADIIEDAEGLTRWWPSVYLSVEVLERGEGAHGVGRVTRLHAKGWLPYTLRWKLRTIESRYPHGFTVEAFEGDFKGRGVWTFEQDGEFVRVGFDWRIRSEKPLISALSFLLKPVFSFNHRWTMRRGEESLKLELARRRARTAEELARIAPPRGPTFPHNLRRRRHSAARVSGRALNL